MTFNDNLFWSSRGKGSKWCKKELNTRHNKTIKSKSIMSKVRAALQLIFEALGPFLLLGKANYKTQLRQIWTKLYPLLLNKHQKDQKNCSALHKFELILKLQPQMENNVQIWPASKNSGHPCYKLCMRYQILRQYETRPVFPNFFRLAERKGHFFLTTKLLG